MTAGRVRTEYVGDVARITIHSISVNLFDPSILAAFSEALLEQQENPHVRALVIGGSGEHFWPEIHPGDMGWPAFNSALAEVCAGIEASDKPVVAALHGIVTGASLELILSAHFRVAHTACRLGFQPGRFGLPPGAGGTQRASRLAGAEAALTLLLADNPLLASQELFAPFVDEFTKGDVGEAAVFFAQRCLSDQIEPRRSLRAITGLSDPRGYMASIDRHRRRISGNDEVEAEIINAVEAALLLRPDAGLAFETAAFEKCYARPEREALQHLLTAERLAGRPRETHGRPTVQLGLAGDGALCTALAERALSAGLSVAHLAPGAEAESALAIALARSWDHEMEAGDLTRVERRAREELLVQADDAAVVAGCEVIIGCGTQQAKLLSETGAHALPYACLATTSLFSLVDDSPLLGLSLRSDGGLAEILSSAYGIPQDAATLASLMERLGWLPVHVQSNEPLSELLRTRQVALAEALASIGVSSSRLASVTSEAGIPWPHVRADATGQPSLADQDILAFLRAGMASLGMDLLRDARVAHASDLDIISVAGLGYARSTGGMMHMAMVHGLLKLEHDITRFSESHPDLFTVDKALSAAILSGDGWTAFEKI